MENPQEQTIQQKTNKLAESYGINESQIDLIWNFIEQGGNLKTISETVTFDKNYYSKAVITSLYFYAYLQKNINSEVLFSQGVIFKPKLSAYF